MVRSTYSIGCWLLLQLFFAKVLRSASEDDVKALFSRYGSVHGINLFRAFQGAPTSKGCGLITMGTNEEAAAAIAALDCKYTWRSMDVPMVVKWMDAALQKKRREEHLMAMRQGLVPSMSMSEWLLPCTHIRFNSLEAKATIMCLHVVSAKIAPLAAMWCANELSASGHDVHHMPEGELRGKVPGFPTLPCPECHARISVLCSPWS